MTGLLHPKIVEKNSSLFVVCFALILVVYQPRPRVLFIRCSAVAQLSIFLRKQFFWERYLEAPKIEEHLSEKRSRCASIVARVGVGGSLLGPLLGPFPLQGFRGHSRGGGWTPFSFFPRSQAIVYCFDFREVKPTSNWEWVGTLPAPSQKNFSPKS